jgi:hypothetical protein
MTTLNRGEPTRPGFQLDTRQPGTRAPARQRRTFTVESVKPDPDAWALAIILARDRDVHCRTQPDGTVLILNGNER